MHVEHAADIGGCYQIGQCVGGCGLDFTLVFAQLRRNVGEAQGGEQSRFIRALNALVAAPESAFVED